MTKHINFPMTSLKNQRIVRVRECWLALHDTHLEYCYNFTANEPQLDTDLWSDVDNILTATALKSFVVGADYSWMVASKKWRTSIHINGYPFELEIFFKTRDEAVALHTEVMAWLLK